MTVIEFGQGKRYYLLVLPTVFLVTLLSISLLFISVFGLGPVGPLLGFLAAFLLTLLAFLLIRQYGS